ncbi:uncharacterized protein LOC115837225 [Nomascus leucogenys]|uniref:uncharacterized protein LOC115837225 n=1 Tax=Nomascus leucogenys TaxID=61853 RepID=UPI00122DB046|nr:uncharacterized protein LOC115837225 [Nomascus leucogenys]
MGFVVKMKQKGRQLCGFSLQSKPSEGKACPPPWGQQRQHPRRRRPLLACRRAPPRSARGFSVFLSGPASAPRRWASCPGRREAGAVPYAAGRNPVPATTVPCSPPRLQSRDARESGARSGLTPGGRRSSGLTAVGANPAAPEGPLEAGLLLGRGGPHPGRGAAGRGGPAASQGLMWRGNSRQKEGARKEGWRRGNRNGELSPRLVDSPCAFFFFFGMYPKSQTSRPRKIWKGIPPCLLLTDQTNPRSFRGNPYSLPKENPVTEHRMTPWIVNWECRSIPGSQKHSTGKAKSYFLLFPHPTTGCLTEGRHFR